MGLKPDHWIRRMALEHGMIEPFVEKQTREGVISFGVSSYGYDMRVADEFKVFCPTIRVRHLNDYQKGYIAAMIDGEGHIGKHNAQRQHHTWHITIGNTNRELMEYVQEMLGVGQIYTQEPSNPKHNTAYIYKITRMADVQHVLGQVYPYLIVKREAALKALNSQSRASQVVDPKAFDLDMVEDFKGSECIIPPNSFALARSIEYFRIPRGVLAVTTGKSTFARCGIITNVTPLEPEWHGFVTLEISNTTPLPAKIYANEGIAQVLFFEADEECEVSYADKKGKYQGQTGVTPPRL
jgi:deoxycytidine triphosphate deaminase